MAASKSHDVSGRGVVPRGDAVDFVKGVLVLLMVLYHWMNYFVSVEANLYRYFRFLTPSFILISGVLVSSVQIQIGRAHV